MIYFIGIIIFIALVFIIFVFGSINCTELDKSDEYWSTGQSSNSLDSSDIYHTTGEPRW